MILGLLVRGLRLLAGCFYDVLAAGRCTASSGRQEVDLAVLEAADHMRVLSQSWSLRAGVCLQIGRAHLPVNSIERGIQCSAVADFVGEFSLPEEEYGLSSLEPRSLLHVL